MKTTIQLSIICLSLLALSTLVHAQSSSANSSEQIIYSIGAEAAFPAGNFKEGTKFSLGFSGQADIPLSANLYANANVGFINFNSRNGKADVHMIPLMIGFKYFPISVLYIQADAGVGILLNKSEGYERTAAILYSPQVGIQLPIGANNSFVDIGLRYQGSSKYASFTDSKVSFLGLRLAYALAAK